MIITSIVLDGLELVGGNYHFFLSGLPDFEKDIVTNDLFSDGVAWGRSKNKPKTLVLDGYILSGGVAAEWALNKVLAPNGLKTLIVNNTYKCKVEVVSRGSNANNSHIISCQLTMPDPYWYAQTAKSVQLGATYSSGVVFGPGQGVIFGPRNVIQNGDFAKDSDGDGVPDGFTLNGASPVSLQSKEFIFIGTSTSAQMTSTIALISGHRYFCYALVKASSSNVRLQINSSTNPYCNHTGNGAYQPLSVITDTTAATFMVIREPDSSGWQDIGVKNFMAIDMGTASTPTPDYNLTADKMAAKYPNYQQEYGGVVFGTSTGGAGTITNSGNADAYPVIHVVGTCSGPSITNLTTGETISVNVTLGDGDELIIDCRPDTCGVYLNGVANIGLKTSPGWMRVVPGDNKIVFSRNSLQSKKHCTVELNERWI